MNKLRTYGRCEGYRARSGFGQRSAKPGTYKSYQLAKNVNVRAKKTAREDERRATQNGYDMITGEIYEQAHRELSRQGNRKQSVHEMRAAGKPSWPQRGGGNPVERSGAGVDHRLTYQQQRASTGLRNAEEDLLDGPEGAKLNWLRTNANQSEYHKYVEKHEANRLKHSQST